MPNHPPVRQAGFHLMVYIREIILKVKTQSHPRTNLNPLIKTRITNDSIAIMLRSYTRAINKQEGFSGSLFRKETKAECLNYPKHIIPSFILKEGITVVNSESQSKEYPRICFNYIHQNPVKAKLVKKESDWEFSSAKNYTGLRNQNIVNKFVTKEYL